MGLPAGNWVLNSKERKKLRIALNEQFGIDQLPDGVYIQNAKDKIYLITSQLDDIEFEKLLIDSLGLYIGAWQIDGFRLSMEGAQLLAPLVKKNSIELDDTQKNLWFKGLDLPWSDVTRSDFVIVKHKNDVLGCGKIRKPREGKDEEATLLNYVPKARRLITINE